MANKLSWDSPYMNHTAYILDHMAELNLEPNELLTLLLIEFYNSQGIIFGDEMMAEKLRISEDDVEEIFESLSDKGFLTIEFKNGDIYFNIAGVMEADAKGEKLSRSLIEEFEMEFKRTLSPNEMSRIMELGDIYGEKRVLIALDEASVRDIRNINYVETILTAWKNKNLSDEDLDEGKR
ncbi:MAG: DnaD domain protein [Bacillota bacterium]|nr:DnaD domain protein [Bacillota bacterium]